MNTVLIQSAVPCDAANQPLPPHPIQRGAFQIVVSPKPFGTTGPLLMCVICSLIPGPTGSVRYRFILQTVADWQFTGPNPTVLTFTHNTSSGHQEYLPFQLRNLKPSGTTFPAIIIVEAMDAALAPPNVDQTVVTLCE